ncbi:MAG: HAD hydrolase-like protein, partial [Bacilli bacterium]
PLEASYVVLSWDRDFNYEKLNDAYQAFVRGAIVIATNPDRTCPLEDGQIPDTGAMIGALEGATGLPIHIIAGKPSMITAEMAVQHLGLDYAACYMVGDRLETDIKMANDTGMNSVLVLTGITNRQMLEDTPYEPKYVIDSIKEIGNV